MGTRGAWGRDLAIALGNPAPSRAIIRWISAWTVGEGTRARFNPLATTYDLPPNTAFNGVGVRNFETRAQGIEATVRTLRGNHPGYSDIVAGIRGNDVQLAQDGLMIAPWGTNGSRVAQVYAARDTSDEPLLAEPDGGDTEVVSRGGTVPEPPRTPRDAGDADDPRPSLRSGPGIMRPGDAPRVGNDLRIAYVIVGSGCLVLALGLAVRTFVPTSQIVKSVAAIAA